MGRVHRVHCPRGSRAPRPLACRAHAAHAPRAAACHPRAYRALPRARACCCAPRPRACSARPRAHARPASTARPLAQRPRLRAPAACALYCRYSDYIVAWLGTLLQYSPALPSPLSQYKILYCSSKISQPKPLSHNTSSVLQYTLCLAYPLRIALQGTISQYNFAYTSCNTIWAVAKFHFSCTNFFFVFIFHLFPAL